LAWRWGVSLDLAVSNFKRSAQLASLAPTFLVASLLLSMPNVILVTGGTGLVSFLISTCLLHSSRSLQKVGEGIRATLEHEAVGSRFGKATEDEQWIFCSSAMGDLK